MALTGVELVGVAAGVTAVVGAFWGIVARFSRVEARSDENSSRIDKLERKLDTDFNKLTDQIKEMRTETISGFASVNETLTKIIFKLADKSDRSSGHHDRD